MTTKIRISGKNLGKFALPNACPRCLYLQLRTQVRLPYQKFPGIFNTIDRYTKIVTESWWSAHNQAPSWLREFGSIKCLLPTPHHATFFSIDLTTNVMLTGDPDAVCQMQDGSLAILDYKTAKFTAGQDELLPIYETQLNSYAWLAEMLGMGKVSTLGLIYFEPLTDISTECIDDFADADGFSMKFSAKVLPLDLQLDRIPPLLHQVRSIFDLAKAPTGRDGCRDCKLLDGLLKTVMN